jgi:tetratricopeptide (TPR) repeat protein
MSRGLARTGRGAGHGTPSFHGVLAGLCLLWIATGGAVRADGHVGSDACRECHPAEYAAWRGSHHDLAMQPASADTVLGDFSDALFTHRGVASRFFRRDGGFWIETQGGDGQTHQYRVAYTFGVTPLQQYLIGFPDGRYQAFTVAWDTRPAAQGGQRWFHLYPDEDIPPGDELHWTAPAHNWNFACAECHSTRLRKNYDATTDTYRTRWSEIDVACEACHGPGGPHVEAAQTAAGGAAPYPADHALAVRLNGRGAWHLAPGQSRATLTRPSAGAAEIEVCGRCHSRRSQLSEDYIHGRALADTHRLQLLSQGYYYPDGQILDEVYVYGSFLQSRMHAAGVTCSDCHEPHSLRPRAEGNALCAACHAASTYDAPQHHHHPPDSSGARCVECHMPERTYMVVDPRRDHGMRIPRPDLSRELGVPDACTGCHRDKGNQWAEDALRGWFGADRYRGRQDFARVLAQAREGAPAVDGSLARLATDVTAPAIVRATALQELTGAPGPGAGPALESGLADDSPLVRRAALEALAGRSAEQRLSMAAPLLRDPVRDVRLAAARLLLDLRPENLSESRLTQGLRQAFDEYLAAQRLNADRAEGWVNLAYFHFLQGEPSRAEQDYAEARRRNPRFVPIYVNQGDMYRALGRESDSERVLREGLAVAPEAATLHYALGLSLIRSGLPSDALLSLERAHRLAPREPRYGLVLGLALQSTGDTPGAVEVWESVVARHPNHLDTLRTLSKALYQSGQHQRALYHAQRAAALTEGSPGSQPGAAP